MFRVTAVVVSLASLAAFADPLPSWQDGASKEAITSFVSRVTRERSPDYLPVDARVAVFDLDEPLQQAGNVELAFAIDEARRLAPQHPEWRKSAPLADTIAAILAGEARPVRTSAEAQALIAATHAGSADAFSARVQRWLAEPTGRAAAQGYLPMRELMTYLRGNGFKTWVVSSGESGFVRVLAESVYGVPPEQVVASALKAKLAVQGGVTTIVRAPAFETLLDGPAKPVAVERAVGRRPVIAFGDSDADLPLLQWVSAGKTRFVGLLRQGEGAEQAQAVALNLGWLVVDAGQDWRRAYASQPLPAGSPAAEPSALVIHARDMLP
ncbi:haloacid dehalogenase [Jeongeupia sp. HS-3]|uniref:HAD family hydrolase n=1 Tax=Jeongeupia sp. HS-3 TaxID=1009682 RepID=UPI0018A63A34|nr:HAD family hydrolase [Jeongeupia sp. HS-3]BCL75763.1 haloacid dehalogenase [Jeongeupia sp. HS-3]